MLLPWERTRLPTAAEALPGRDAPAFELAARHAVSGAALLPPFPDGSAIAIVGMGCFWGAERTFWTLPGVVATMVGYAGGITPNPTYREVCSGRTGHNEVVRVIFDPARLPYERLLAVFWEGHDPTQGMRQGNDVGTQYRSGIYTHDAEQQAIAEASRRMYEGLIRARGYGRVTTEILSAPPFWYAEEYHQQYLAKNPGGYCGLGGTGVGCPVGVLGASG